jgi:hypothetical protein
MTTLAQRRPDGLSRVRVDRGVGIVAVGYLFNFISR